MQWLKSANFTGYNGSHFYIALYYDILSQSNVSNQSVVRYYLYVGSGDGYSASGNFSTGYIGDSAVGGLSYIGVNSFNYIGYRDIVYTHNQDGSSPTINYWASFKTNWDIGTASLNGTFTLPAIQRYAIITEGTNFTDESYPTVTMTNVGLYPIKARMLVGTTVIYDKNIDDQTITSYAYDLTSTEKNQLRQLCTGKTLDVKLEIVSIDGQNSYTSSTNVVMSIVNAEPDFSYTVRETDQNVIDVLGGTSASSIIDNVSKIKITVSPTTYKYASVSAVSVVSGDKTYTSTTSPYEIIVPVTDNTFTISVVDSRGYTTTKVDSDRTLIPYEPLKINNFSFVRENPISSNVILNADILYYDSFGSITNTRYVQWKLDDGSFTTIPASEYSIDPTNHKLTITNYEISNVLDYNLQGQFTLKVIDLLTETQDSGDKGLVLKGVATFEAGEHDFQVNGDLIVCDTERENPVNIVETLLSNINTTVNYEMEHVTSTLGANAWRELYVDESITIEEDGLYLIIANVYVGTTTSGMITCRPTIDGNGIGILQTTYSAGDAYIINMSMSGVQELREGTYTLNVEGISQSSMTLNSDGNISLIKII